MGNKSVRNCHTASQFKSVAVHQGAEIRRGGRHDLIYKDGSGPVAVPRHKGDLPNGTRYSIEKGLLALGLLAVTLICSAFVLTVLGTLQALP